MDKDVSHSLYLNYQFSIDSISDGGGYGQNNYSQANWNQGQGGGWSSDYNSGYGNSYGGGPVRGGNNYSHRSSGPYGGSKAPL